MAQDAHKAIPADTVSAAFEHNITWEDDLWRSDPVDVEHVHRAAREKFADLLETVTSEDGGRAQARILLFHGQSGAGKTHLLRALRTRAHRQGKAYFGYAQMSPDVTNYADYFLRRLIASLEKPYDPDAGGVSALSRLTRGLCEAAAAIDSAAVERLREAELPPKDLARLVLQLADDIVASPRFAEEEVDINIVRALLYLERSDPRIDQRIRQYLYGRPLNELAHEAVAALDPGTGEARPFEIIESLGKLMWAVDRAALVFSIDQVEDLAMFDDGDERFQRAVRDLIQIANRVPTSIILIACLGDFYTRAREVLVQSYIDRIEKAGPIYLAEPRTPIEIRSIIAKRLHRETEAKGHALTETEAEALFPAGFYDEFAGLSLRRLLEYAQKRCAEAVSGEDASTTAVSVAPAEEPEASGFLSALAAALGMGGQKSGVPAMVTPSLPPTRAASLAPARPVHLDVDIDYRDLWDRFSTDFEAEMPSDDEELLAELAGALALMKDEWKGTLAVTVRHPAGLDDLPTIDIQVQHPTGHAFDARVFLCNRPTQGGGLKRQLEKVLAAMNGKTCFMLRASEFPPSRKNQTASAFRKFRDGGGRTIMVPLHDWERLMMVREFHARHRNDPGFAEWFEQAKLLTGIASLLHVLRLDLLGHGTQPRKDVSPPVVETPVGIAPDHNVASPVADQDTSPDQGEDDLADLKSAMSNWPSLDGLPTLAPDTAETRLTDWRGWGPGGLPPVDFSDEDELPLSVILDEIGDDSSRSIQAGREIGGGTKSITLNTSVLKRHAAVLGGSGSGKTTLALALIEQLLMRGIPAVLIDRKGDLCSYANPDVWRTDDNDASDRQSEREKLGDSIDVAVYTPGRTSGRPISITLLPNGIRELPEHEQQLLANMSSAALGDMLHLKNSATHQKQSGTLSVALKILGSRSNKEVTLGDLIYLLEDEDPELTDLTQRMDPSGRIRRDLVAQLDSLRHRNSVLFEGGGESLRMESLLGLGRYARPGRTRLSVIYTGFLGDNENILFWVSQFLSEALRFCQRNPNDELQAVVMFDEADLYIPANSKPATSEPLQSLLKRARSAGLGLMLATQSPGDLDYKSRDQITSWFIGRVREDTALRKLKAAFQSESGLDPAAVLPGQTVGEFHLVQEGLVRALKAHRSLISAEQVPFDRIEQLAYETKGQDERQLRLFDRI